MASPNSYINGSMRLKGASLSLASRPGSRTGKISKRSGSASSHDRYIKDPPPAYGKQKSLMAERPLRLFTENHRDSAWYGIVDVLVMIASVCNVYPSHAASFPDNRGAQVEVTDRRTACSSARRMRFR